MMTNWSSTSLIIYHPTVFCDKATDFSGDYATVTIAKTSVDTPNNSKLRQTAVDILAIPDPVIALWQIWHYRAPLQNELTKATGTSKSRFDSAYHNSLLEVR